MSSVWLRRSCAITLALAAASPGIGEVQGTLAADTSALPELVVQLGHFFPVDAIAISSDGRYVVTGSFDRMARLWRVEGGEEVRRFAADHVTAVAFSPDGRYVLTGSGHRYSSDFAVRMWDIESGEQVRAFEGHEAQVSSVAFSPDGGQVLTASWDGTAVLWRTAAGTAIRRIQEDDPILQAAFSPDGTRLLTVSGGLAVYERERSVAVRRTADGRELHRISIPEVAAVALAPDNRLLLLGTTDGLLRRWDVASGRELPRIATSVDYGAITAFSPNGRIALARGSDCEDDPAGLCTMYLQEVHTGREVGRLRGRHGSYGAAAFSSDGRFVLTRGTAQGAPAHPAHEGVWMWNAATGEPVQHFAGRHLPRGPVAVSGDGVFLVRASGSTFVMWSITEGRELRRLSGGVGEIHSLSVSFDGRHALIAGSTDDSTGNSHETAELWDLGTATLSGRYSDTHDASFSPRGRFFVLRRQDSTLAAEVVEIRPVSKPHSSIFTFDRARGETLLAFSRDGSRLLGAHGNDAFLRDLPTGTVIRHLQGHRQSVVAGALSDDARTIATRSEDGIVQLWHADADAPFRTMDGLAETVHALALSGDGSWIAAVEEHSVGLWATESGRERGRFDAFEEVAEGSFEPASVSFSPDNQSLLISDRGLTNATLLWSPDTDRVLWTYRNFETVVRSATFLPDGRSVITDSPDGAATVWSAETGAPLARLISFRNDNWAVVAPGGRFDAGDLEALEGLHWIMPDEPLTPLPVEAFMRDYYEPRLLPRLLAGEQFPKIGGLMDRNRVQPEVEITTVAWQTDGTATVQVEVRSVVRAYGGQMRTSEVHDVRLFRDGQLVAWRDGQVATGQRSTSFTFSGIALASGADSVAFSVYAFNSDRVKSRTAYRALALPQSAPRPRRAYVISLGVDRFDESSWNLHFAANDAVQFQRVLPQLLRGEFAEVVPISLLSPISGVPEGAGDARKETLRALLALLAGHEVAPALRPRIPGAERLRKATPDDLILITLSTHGYSDEAGVFYLLPQDVPPGGGKQITPELLHASISSDDLREWLRGIDAGEFVMIVDACHAAAAVEGADFKPGPMGSRGLGQLAFDKAMRILTATQSADVALESGALQQGLLSFALLDNGLLGRQADHAPQNGQITLREWLTYGVRRVPELHREVQAGQVQTFGRGEQRGFEVVGGAPEAEPRLQTPALFDFAPRRPTVVLIRE